MSSTKFNIAGFARAAEENVYNDDDNMNIRHEDEFFENDEMRQQQDDFNERKAGSSFVQEDRKDWKPRHQDLEGERDKGVVPAEWRYGQQEVQRKGDKNTFYCEVCHVELNSLETMKSHANGAKHQKKMLALESERMENLRRGILPGEKMPGIKPISNPASAKVSNDSIHLFSFRLSSSNWILCNPTHQIIPVTSTSTCFESYSCMRINPPTRINGLKLRN